MINEYHFGHITIDGKTYTHDVEVGKQVIPWTRNAGHVIDVQDIQRAVNKNPDTIIIGTGESGIAKVTEQAKKEIENKNIHLIIAKTAEAVTIYNRSNNAIGLFHLTC